MRPVTNKAGAAIARMQPIASEFRQMLQQSEYIDKPNAKPSWSHVELVAHLVSNEVKYEDLSLRQLRETETKLEAT